MENAPSIVERIDRLLSRAVDAVIERKTSAPFLLACSDVLLLVEAGCVDAAHATRRLYAAGAAAGLTRLSVMEHVDLAARTMRRAA